MATIGNMASVQYKMAVVNTKQQMASALYSNRYNKYNTSVFNSKSVDETLDNLVKYGDDYIKQEYEKLYNSVFGSKEEDSAEKAISVKQAAFNTSGSAESLERFADGLKYGGEYDKDEAQKVIEGFVEDYNTFIESLGEAENTNVLQKGVILVNTAKVYSGSLQRAGITLGSDNKLTFDAEKMPNVSATDLKTTFGEGGFASKVIQKAEQINRLAGSSGAFSYTAASTQSYAYTIGALFSTYA